MYRLSLVNYDNLVWGTTSKTNILKVQKIKKFAAEVIDGKARKFEHVTPILRELKWLTTEKQIIFDTAVTVYKTVRKIAPYHSLHLPLVNTITYSNTRQQNNLYIPKVNTDSGASHWR